MILQETVRNYCPYCGEPIELIIDCSQNSQQYIEDCQVCCRPMEIQVQIDSEGDPAVSVAAEFE